MARVVDPVGVELTLILGIRYRHIVAVGILYPIQTPLKNTVRVVLPGIYSAPVEGFK